MTPLGIETDTIPRSQRKHAAPQADQTLILKQALASAFTKLDPRLMVKNPVMFVVEIGFLLTVSMCFNPQLFGPTPVTQTYVIWVMLILFVTLLFANFAEAYAEGRGKAQADTLRKTKASTQARRMLDNGECEWVASSDLRAGNLVRVEAEELIPSDGEVVDGIASVDESAITGESDRKSVV